MGIDKLQDMTSEPYLPIFLQAYSALQALMIDDLALSQLHLNNLDLTG